MRSLMFLLVLVSGCNTSSEAPNDGDPLSDMPAGVCHSPTGRVCGYSAYGGCPADDGANWCDCEFGSFACTQVGVITDGGPPGHRCMATSECPGTSVCVFDPGCTGEKGRCTGAYECTQGGSQSFCGCDGKSFSSDGPCADRPHSGKTC